MQHLFVLLAQADPAPDKAPPELPHPLLQFVPLILIFLVFIFLIVLPARRRERQQREQLFKSLKKNDEVLTSGGIIGIVANIKDQEDEVTLKVDESSNVRIRVLKSSIIRILTPKEPGGQETAVRTGSPPQ
jgi:preprotein translocase subunit YajC